MKPVVTMYTAGSCSGNPGPGGWGVVLEANGGGRTHRRELHGSASSTTNNQMELRAILEGLRALKRPCRVTIVTDSRNALGWLSGRFRRRNPAIWDLCAQIDDIVRDGGHEIEFRWVPGHTGHPGNERADQLAHM